MKRKFNQKKAFVGAVATFVIVIIAAVAITASRTDDQESRGPQATKYWFCQGFKGKATYLCLVDPRSHNGNGYAIKVNETIAKQFARLNPKLPVSATVRTGENEDEDRLYVFDQRSGRVAFGFSGFFEFRFGPDGIQVVDLESGEASEIEDEPNNTKRV